MRFRWTYVFVLAMLSVVPALAQHDRGEIRLRVRDSKGEPLVASVELASEANQVQRKFLTHLDGAFTARDLPFGIYHLQVSHQGFVPFGRLIEIDSEVPLMVSVTLGLAPVRSQVNVSDSATLVDTERAGTVYPVGPRAINEEMPAQLGRGLGNLVNSQPGWLYEANGVLHPRGSEYDVQYVVNGVPRMNNRSPAFAPPLATGNVESMRIMTAGFPAEYGRKLGGVVEISTPQELASGLHLTAVGGGGSFSTSDGYLGIGYAHGANQLMLTGNAGSTDRYLDPPVIPNYTNHGSTGGFTATYSREISDRQRLRLFIRHAVVRYLVPNELVQQEAGQLQNAMDGGTSGQANYEQTLSPSLLFNAEASVRDETFRLWSNSLATPVVIGQRRGFRQGYDRLDLAGQHGAHNWKIGADVIFNPVHEKLEYLITDPSLFDPGTALRFNFLDHRNDVESSAFAQDAVHRRNWNVRFGLRYDYYNFVLNQSAWSPRLAVSHYFASSGILAHASYDRVFQTPAMENLLLASSPQLNQVNKLVLRLPVEPARANYYEVGLTKGFWGKLRIDTNIFRRDFLNFPDDDTLLSTGVSFPIADASAKIQGVEVKLEIPRWGRFSGFASYANQEGIAQGPVTGGLLIGAEAIAGAPDNSRFWISQDQRNTARARLRFQATKRLWLATDSSFGSGLPVELDTGDTNYDFLLAQYGPRILGQVDFAHGRVRPSYSLGVAAGLDLYHKENRTVSLEAQASNLTNRLNVINFASLFSGTAIGVPRTFGARLKVSF